MIWFLLKYLLLADGEVGVLKDFYLFVLAQCPLFLSMLHYLLLHIEAFAAAHTVHVFQSLVFRVCFLTKVQVFLFCGGNPVGITADHLIQTRKTIKTKTLAARFFAG